MVTCTLVTRLLREIEECIYMDCSNMFTVILCVYAADSRFKTLTGYMHIGILVWFTQSDLKIDKFTKYYIRLN